MFNDLLTKIRKLSTIMQNCTSEKLVFDDIFNELKNVTDVNVILVDKSGEIYKESLCDEISIIDKKIVNKVEYIENQLNDQLKNIVETKENLSLSDFYIKRTDLSILKKFKLVVSPVNVISERLGTLLFYKQGADFSDEELIYLEAVSNIVGLVMLHAKSKESAEEMRKLNIVKSAINTLSYSELEAIQHIFKELDGVEGLLVASKIADKVGITRSVIVNALRKFESAGVIESRSLGMKGTYIKVLNDNLLPELYKLN